MSQKVLGNQKRGKLFVVSAPAGTGKTTLVNQLLEEFSDTVKQTRSCTTRRPRGSEKEHYTFVSVEEFEEQIESGDFLEHAKVFGDYYGTPKSEVEGPLKEGKHVVLVIDTQGAMQIKKEKGGVFIFIAPPSLEELKKRLFKRETEDEKTIERRLSWAEKEMEVGQKYDYHIVNDDLSITYEILKSIFIAEEHRCL